MGALQRFVGAAAGALGEHYGQVAQGQAKDKLLAVRDRRLSQLRLEEEEVLSGRKMGREQEMYDITQERERQQLTDPTSNLALKRGQEFEDYEKRLRLQKELGIGKGSSTGIPRSNIKVHKYAVGTDPMSGDTIYESVVEDLSTGQMTPAAQYFRGQAGGAVPEAGETDPVKQLMLQRRGGALTPEGEPGEKPKEAGWRDEQFVGLGVSKPLTKEDKEGLETLALVDETIIELQNEGKFVTKMQAQRWLKKLEKIKNPGDRWESLNFTKQYLKNVIEGK